MTTNNQQQQLSMFEGEKQEDVATFLIVNLFPHWTTCGVCGEDLMLVDGGYYLPMYEGEVVNPDIREWAGYPVCPKCYREHEYKTRLDAFGVDRSVSL